MLWLTIVVFVGLLLALVLVHEWGHFITAKKAGCKVEEFGFGFPPRLFGYRWRGTLYSFNLLPIGGFVKIEGEDMQDENPGPTNFGSKTASWRILILSAGVIMNVILAFGLLTGQAFVGRPVLVTEENEQVLADVQTYVLEVAPGSPAEEAGLQELDRIVRLDNEPQPVIRTVQKITQTKAGEVIELEIDRAGIRETLKITPRVDPPDGEGALGVSLASTGLEKIAWYLAPWEGLKRTGLMLSAIVTQFALIIWRLVTGSGMSADLTGPVGIAVYANEVTQLGLSYILEFGALISLNLALINILPFPALDGGRILFVVIEKLRGGKRAPAKIEQWVHTAGFLLLIGLMILITVRDVGKFWG